MTERKEIIIQDYLLVLSLKRSFYSLVSAHSNPMLKYFLNKIHKNYTHVAVPYTIAKKSKSKHKTKIKPLPINKNKVLKRKADNQNQTLAKNGGKNFFLYPNYQNEGEKRNYQHTAKIEL